MKKFIKNSTKKLKNNKGFTLLEIMATVTLLGIMYTMVNTSVMSMQRQVASSEVESDVDQLYFNIQDILVDLRVEGSYEDVIKPGNDPSDDGSGGTGGSGGSTPGGVVTPGGVTSSGLWRGFNPTTTVASGTYSGFDVAYMVEYPDYTFEDPTTPIDYTNLGIDVDEGYQIPALKDLIAPKAGVIQAYGILFELHTGTLLETTLIQIPYDASGSDAQTTYNARLAAKYASSIIGSGVRDPYQTAAMPSAFGGTALSIYDLFYTPTVSEINGYGDSHMFNRDNMLSSISDEMLQQRYKYLSWVSFNGNINGLDDYLQPFNRDTESVFSFCGLDI